MDPDSDPNMVALNLLNCSVANGDLSVALRGIRGLLYTNSLIAPTEQERLYSENTQGSGCSHGACSSKKTCEDCLKPWQSTVTHPLESLYCTEHINALTREQQRTLWHMRLGHINHQRIADAHEFADGIPNLPDKDSLHKCPICTRAKLHKAARVATEDLKQDEIECWDHVQIDFGFMVQRSRRHDDPKEEDIADEISDSPTLPMDISTLTRAQQEALAEALEQANKTGDPNIKISGTSSASTYPIGTKICKKFNAGWYNGSVQSYDAESKFYHVEYTDGDSEDMTEDEVRSHLLSPASDDSGEGVVHPPQDEDQDTGTVPPSPARPARKDATRPARPRERARSQTRRPPNKKKKKRKKRETSKERFKRLVGLNGETCYVLITDRKSGAWQISIRRDKSPPLDFFRHWISRYGTGSRHRSVRFDGGGELGRSTEVQELFRKAGYKVEVTGPDSSSEIGAVERPHRIIADGVRTMLHAAGLPYKFWPYALTHFVLIANCIPRGDRKEPPITICSGKRPDFRLLRVFGCRIYALPPGRRNAKLDVHARQGVFLGFKDTFRHAYYYDFDTDTVKHSRHIAFDESQGFHKEPPPYVDVLNRDGISEKNLPKGTKDTANLDDDDDEILDFSLSPFIKRARVKFPFHPTAEQPLGFSVAKDERFLRAFAYGFADDQDGKSYHGAYILRVHDTDVYSDDDVQQVLDKLAASKSPPSEIEVTFATDWKNHLSDKRPPPPPPQVLRYPPHCRSAYSRRGGSQFRTISIKNS